MPFTLMEVLRAQGSRVKLGEGKYGINWTKNISQHNPKGQVQEWVQENLPNTKIKYKIISENGP